jgi:hypothetical protein
LRKWGRVWECGELLSLIELLEDASFFELGDGMANGDMGLVGELLGSRHVDDRMCGKGADELAHGRVAAGLAEAVQPSGLKAFDPLCEFLCLSCGSCRSVRKTLAPNAGLSLAVRAEAADIVLGFASQHETDRRDVVAGLAAAAHGVDDRQQLKLGRTAGPVSRSGRRRELQADGNDNAPTSAPKPPCPPTTD